MAVNSNGCKADGTVGNVGQSKEACRLGMLTGSSVYKLVFLPRTSVGVKEELSGVVSPWRAQSAFPDYWPDRGQHQVAVGNARCGGKTQSDVHYSKHQLRHTGHHSSFSPDCPIHAPLLVRTVHRVKEEDDDASVMSSTSSQARNCTKVTSPRSEQESISLLPERSQRHAQTRPSGNDASPRFQATHATGHGNLSAQYTPFHLYKQLLGDQAARVPPLSGVELRQLCQQLSSYLWTREQQMQVQQQTEGASNHSRALAQANTFQMLQVCNSATTSHQLPPEQYWMHRTEQVHNQDCGEDMRRKSLTAVNVEPNLPTFSSAFDHLIIEPGCKYNLISRASHQRRPSNPPVSNLPLQSNWTVTQKAVQAELLSLDCTKIKEEPAALSSLVSKPAGRDRDMLVLESKEARADRQSWRPADSLDTTAHYPHQHQQHKPAKVVSHTCSMVEMSLPSPQSFQKNMAPAKHAGSLVSFPMIPRRGKQRHISIQGSRNRTAHDKLGQRAKLPQIDGCKFMGDVTNQPSLASQSVATVPAVTVASQKAKKKAQPPNSRTRPKLTRTLGPMGDAGSAAAQATNKSNTGHLAVEWRAV